MKLETYQKYVNTGWRLFEANENKTPRKPFKGITQSDPYRPEALYAGVPPVHILVIDVDVRGQQGKPKKGLESFQKLKAALGNPELLPNVQTRSGGFHYYVYVDKKKPLINKNQKPEYPDIDFIQDSGEADRYVILGDQVLQDGSEYKLLNLKYNNKLAKLYEIGLKYKFTSVSRECDDVGYESCEDKFYVPLSYEEIQNCLEYIDYDCYDSWIRVGMILKNEGCEDAFDIFDTWSKKSYKYPGRHEVERYYSHFNVMENGLRYGTLVDMAARSKCEKLLNEVISCKNDAELSKIVEFYDLKTFPYISKKCAEDLKNDFAKSAYNKRLKSAFNKHIDKALAYDEEQIAAAEFAKVVRISGRSSTKNGSYFIVDKGHEIDEREARAELDSAFKQMESVRSHVFTMTDAINERLILTALDVQYNPEESERLYYDNQGRLVYNLFSKDSLPPVSASISEAGMPYVQTFVQHIILTWGEYATLFLDYLAFLVQNPGRKVRWMIIFQGMEGLGKSIVFDIIASHLLGESNCSTASMADVRSDYNNWAFDKLLILIEELSICIKTEGHLVNNLKTLVTNNYAKKHKKYMDSTQVINKTNYIAFTNEAVPMPVKIGNRRFCFCRSNIRDLRELEQRTGVSRHEYFVPLVDLARYNNPYGRDLRRYFMDYKISPDFSPDFLPRSTYTDIVISNSNVDS